MRERSQAKGLSGSFLEPDWYEDEGEDLEQSLLAIKNKYKKKLAKGFLISDWAKMSFFGYVTGQNWNQVIFFYLGWFSGRFPFVRTDQPFPSLSNENFTINQNYPARSVKS